MEFLFNKKNLLLDPNPYNSLNFFSDLLEGTLRTVLHNVVIKPQQHSLGKLKVLFKRPACEISLFWKFTVNFRKEKLIKVIWKLVMMKLKLLIHHEDCEYILIVAEVMVLSSYPREGSINMRKKVFKWQNLELCIVILKKSLQKQSEKKHHIKWRGKDNFWKG